MYNTCGECGQADCQCGSYSSRSRCKWIVLALCCCLLLATILGVVLGLIPVYLKDKYDRTYVRRPVPGPLAIPNDGATSLSDAVNVDLDKTIKSSTQISVALDILHASVSELIVSLISPDGTTVRLHNNTPGTNLLTTYPTLTTPFQSLNAFQNRLTRGQWILRILDNNGAINAGQLRQWSLRFLKD